MEEEGRGQSWKPFPRTHREDFQKGCIYLPGKEESGFEPKAGFGETGKLSVGCLKSERPVGLSGEMPWSLGLWGQVWPRQERAVVSR